MNIIIKEFNEISSSEMYAILALRSAIFVVEQDCVYQDIDYKDQKATHIFGIKDGKIVAYTRIFKSGIYCKEASIGRVAVAKSDRSFGYGKVIMQASIEAISKIYGEKIIKISAQTYLKKFYNSLGFLEEGAGYLEDGIPHIAMIRKES